MTNCTYSFFMEWYTKTKNVYYVTNACIKFPSIWSLPDQRRTSTVLGELILLLRQLKRKKK